MTEKQIQNQIMQYLATCDRLRFWRQNTGVAKFGDTRVAFGIVGQADISGLVWPSGRRLEIEVKTTTGRQSDAQVAFAAMIRKHGGLYVLARCVGDVRDALVSNFPDADWPAAAE